jgi:hypothetical protein
MKKTIFSFIALILIISFNNTIAQIPRIINYQGMLMGNNSQPVSNGNYDLTFNLYDESSTVIWTEVHNQVAVRNGLFQVILGTITPFGNAFDKPYTLGIQIGSDAELQPRIQLASVAYSIRAEDADKLMGIYASTTPEPNKLLPLDASGKFPGSVMPIGSDADEYIQKNSPDTSRGTSTDPMLLVSNLGDGDGIDARSADGVGLAGRSTNSNGVSGWTEASGKSGVFGYSTDGEGVVGRSDNDYGVVGWTGAANKSGVFGHTDATDGIGVSGIAGGAGDAVGIYALNSVEGNYAKLGTADYGVLGQSFSGDGVYGQSDRSNGDGVVGVANGSYACGVYGTSNNGDGVYGYTLGGNYGVYGRSDAEFIMGSFKGYGVYGEADNCVGVYGRSENNTGVVGASNTGVAIAAAGDFVCYGSKAAEVKLKDGTLKRLFAEEAAEVYFNDYGEETLNFGRTHIELDPLFLQTVTINDQHPMKVFVQLNDNCKGVFVTNRSATGFDVIELQNGSSNAHFTYRVVCKRKYYEDERLPTEEQAKQYTKRMMETVWPEIIEQHKTDKTQIKKIQFK